MSQERLQQCNTMKDLMNQVVFTHSNEKLLNTRKNDTWKSYSSKDIEKEVSNLSCGLAKLGIKSGDRVALLIPSSAYWVFFDLALLSIGAISIPVFTNVSQEVLDHQITHAEVSYLVIENEIFLNNFL